MTIRAIENLILGHLQPKLPLPPIYTISLRQIRGMCTANPPPTHCFSAESCKDIWPTPIGWQPRVSRTWGRLSLVDWRRPAALFYWSAGREDDSNEGSSRYSYRLSRAYKHQLLPFSYLLLDNEHISGSHFPSFLHILPLKQLHKDWFSTNSLKTHIILQ